MKNARDDHPTLARLEAFGLGRLAPAELAETERHVADCPRCCKVLRRVQDDTLIGVLKVADTDNAPSGVREVAAANQPAAAAADVRFSLASSVFDDEIDVSSQLAAHPRYRIVKVLGAGGMGVVYQAEHRLMERTVALKVIARSLINNPNAVERFRFEVKTAGRLAHPNIVAALDAEQFGDLHFLVMEYVEGTSLARVVEKHGPLPPLHACSYIRQAALGLQHACKQGMVHRDIKPHNLMLTRKGQVKILDFGLARFARESNPAGTLMSIPDLGGNSTAGLTGAGLVVGTPDYIAPEQVKDSRKADIRADIYSLGCTLYYLLAAREPFPDGTAYEKVMNHALEQPTALGSLRPDLPVGLVAVVEKMMAKQPADRYQTPAAVAQALAPFARANAAGPAPANTFLLTDNEIEPLSPRVRTPRRVPRKTQPARSVRAKLAWWWKPVAVGAAVMMLVLAALVAFIADGRRPTSQDNQRAVNRMSEAEDARRPAAIAPGQPVEPSTSRPPHVPAAPAPKAAPGTTSARVLVVLPSSGFHYPDYAPVRRVLDEAGVKVVIASSITKPARADTPGEVRLIQPDLALAQAKAKEYDAVIFCGGKGVTEFMGTSPGANTASKLIGEMLAARKPVAGLCMGAGVLLDAGVLRGKRATGFSWLKEKMQKGGVEYVDESVVDSFPLITGRDPASAVDFARTLLRALGRGE